MPRHRSLPLSLLLLALALSGCGSDDTTGAGAPDGTTGDGGCPGTPAACFCGTPICVDGKWTCSSCGDTGGGADGDAADSGSSDAADVGDAGSIACGSKTCGPNQVCVQDCCGGAPTPDAAPCTPPPPTCFDIPADCGGTPTCGCLKVPTSQCRACFEVKGRNVGCGPCA